MSICSIEGCGEQVRARGWCRLHWVRWYRNGDPLYLKSEHELKNKDLICLIEGCTSSPVGRGWCRLHYTRWYKYGDPLTVKQKYNPEPTYRAVHKLLVDLYGPASELICIDCGEYAAQWSYNREDPQEEVNEKGRPFSSDPEYYEPRCIPCHKLFDLSFKSR